jgi:NAD(P)-dependent dehydrogenase (short-subunit alcohol dehydrogenase family)
MHVRKPTSTLTDGAPPEVHYVRCGMRLRTPCLGRLFRISPHDCHNTTSSGAARDWGWCAYAASKWALEALSECLAQEMKAFNIRVAVVEPGVVATPIFSKATPLPNDSPYPHSRRLQAWFKASLTTGTSTSPYVVGEQIRQIVDGASWQLRYPVGTDAATMLKWRASKTDEDVVESQSGSDAEYIAGMKKLYNLDVIL